MLVALASGTTAAHAQDPLPYDPIKLPKTVGAHQAQQRDRVVLS